jgi:hypothetical protein
VAASSDFGKLSFGGELRLTYTHIRSSGLGLGSSAPTEFRDWAERALAEAGWQDGRALRTFLQQGVHAVLGHATTSSPTQQNVLEIF